MFDWFNGNETALWWLAIISAVLFVATLVALPLFLIRIRPEHFQMAKASDPARHPAVNWIIQVSRNLFGMVLIVAGLAMLVLPGQGLLTILIGLLLVDFPGKQRALHWIVAKPAVRGSIDRLRHKAGRPPLIFDE